MANLDSNHWYQILVNDHPAYSFWGAAAIGETGVAYFENTDTAKPINRWQFFPVKNKDNTYVLRTEEAGPNAFLGTAYTARESSPGQTRALMLNATVADDSIFWTIKPWGDGTFYMTNKANGTDWHLKKKQEDDFVIMDSNTTAPQPRQSWEFDGIDGVLVNDKAFSTYSLPTATATPTPKTTTSPTTEATAPSTKSPSGTTSSLPTASPSTGLTTGAQIGIGVGIGAVVLIALLSLILFLLKRRKRQKDAVWAYHQQAAPPYSRDDPSYPVKYRYEMEHDVDTAKYEMGSDLTSAKYEMDSADYAAKYEMGDSTGVATYELPHTQVPEELPATAVAAKAR